MSELPMIPPRDADTRLQRIQARAESNRAALKASIAALGASVQDQMPDERLKRELEERPYAIVGGAVLVGLCLGILL